MTSLDAADSTLSTSATEAATATESEQAAAPGLEERTREKSLAWGLAATGASLLAALLSTWPSALNIWTAIPTGTEPKGTVQLYSLWTLWWTADRFAHGFVNYWEAPIFYPNSGVFTYSEPEPLIGLSVAPLWGLGASPAFIHNIALVLILTLNGVFAYRLARALNASQLPSLLGAVLAVTLPFVAREYGITNLTPIFGILWALEGLVRFGRQGTWRDAVWMGAGLVVTFLTCEQYLLMFAPLAAVGGLVALGRQGFGLRPILRLGVAFLVAGAIIFAVALPMLTVHSEQGFARSSYVVQALSAEFTDFVTRPGTSWLPFPPRYLDDTGGLFPGIILLALALGGAALGWRDRERRPWVIYMVSAALVAVVLALGLNLNFDGISPYDALRQVLPGYSRMRAPFRFALIMQLVLPVLAALALTYVYRRWGRRSLALIVPLALLGAVENMTIPNPMMDLPSSASTAWTTWLRDQPDGTVVAHVPFPSGTTVWDYEIDGWRMLAQTDHHKPMVNGFSSYFPNGYGEFQKAMAQSFPDQELLCQLNKGTRANTLVVDRQWLTEGDHEAQMAKFSKYVTKAYEDAQVRIYRLSMQESDCVP